MTAPEINEAKDVAQQVVTLILHGDRSGASDLVLEFDHPPLLALVLADLLTYVHHSWFTVCATRAGITTPATPQDLVEQWQAILLDIAERRAA